MSADVGGCLDALSQAAAVARRLGLDTRATDATVAELRTRLGFPSTAFVLALAGGTGVGKSSLLNALAGHQVSRPGPIRPVTTEPVAWAPAAARADLAPLLDWVGVRTVATHDDPAFAELCVLDLPDYDSVEAAHRARVDEILPKVDAVCWVLDPEKYNDRVLHEDYLRPLARHAERAVFVVNRRDLLGSPAAVAELTADVRRSLAADGITGRPVFAVSAAPPDGRVDRGELEQLRAWLSERMQAKRVVIGRVVADCLAAGAALGREAGLDGADAARPLVGERARAAATGRAVAAAEAAVDLPGVRRACQRRTWAEARRRGAGPLGRATAAVARLRGRRAELPSSPSIDPAGYARAWRARASLSRAVNPVHELLRQAAAGAPPSLRPRIMALVAPERLEERLAAAVDAAVFQAGTDRAPAPRARLWTVIGLLQALATGAVAVACAWYATLFLAGQAHADLPRLPTWHRVPLPLVLLVAGVAGSLVLARLLRWSARRAAGRWADRLTGALRGEVAREVEAAVAAPLAGLEAARAELATQLGRLRAAANAG